MQSAVELSEKGRRRKVALIEALILQQAQCGLQGDWKASDSLLDRYERLIRVTRNPAATWPRKTSKGFRSIWRAWPQRQKPWPRATSDRP